METMTQKCFIIMPFSKTTDKHTEEYWTTHYEKFLKITIKKVNGINVSRSKPVRGDIIKEIIFDLISSDIVVADLTDANPNVYWELGIRQSFKHGTITIAETGTKLPFDINNKGTLWYYPNDYIKNTEFETNLTDAIKDCIENPNRPDSKVLETITGRGSFYEIIQEEEVTRKMVGLGTEFFNNLKIYKQLKKRVDSNQATTLKRVFSVQLFRIASIELLISHRYLKASDNFYKLAEQYFDHLNSVNSRIISWPTRPGTIEKWILKVYDEDKYFNKFFDEGKKVFAELKK